MASFNRIYINKLQSAPNLVILRQPNQIIVKKLSNTKVDQSMFSICFLIQSILFNFACAISSNYSSKNHWKTKYTTYRNETIHSNAQSFVSIHRINSLSVVIPNTCASKLPCTVVQYVWIRRSILPYLPHPLLRGRVVGRRRRLVRLSCHPLHHLENTTYK